MTTLDTLYDNHHNPRYFVQNSQLVSMTFLAILYANPSYAYYNPNQARLGFIMYTHICMPTLGLTLVVMLQQLQKYYYLCEDSVWGVRKACVECFMQVSVVCSPEIRRTELSQMFINLIYDQSRWVNINFYLVVLF